MKHKAKKSLTFLLVSIILLTGMQVPFVAKAEKASTFSDATKTVAVEKTHTLAVQGMTNQKAATSADSLVSVQKIGEANIGDYVT